MLKDILKNYTKDIYPMHMPGHKGGRYKLMDELYKVDVTEVPGTDHLYNAVDVLAESMAAVEAFYGAKRSIYLVGGSTVGILSAIGGVHDRGDQILLARNCHQSVYNAVSLYGLDPVYIYPKMTQWGLLGGIDPEEVRLSLAANPEVVAFVMTSPTYDGFISNIPAIKEICDRYNVVLIVDEAHGGHLPYSDLLPASALDADAHIVVHSLHKTLPVITGGGMLHMNLAQDLEDKVLKELARLQTSSPSYIMMAMMDACVDQLGKDKKVWSDLLKAIDKMTLSLKKMKKLYALTDYRSIEEGVVASDPLKSIILTHHTIEDGLWLEDHLRRVGSVQMELSDLGHCLGILSVADTGKALNAYGKALHKADRKAGKGKGSVLTFKVPRNGKKAILPWKAEASLHEWVSIEGAIDRIAGAMITPYPPGVPVAVPGEKLSNDLLKALKIWSQSGMEILGIKDGCVCVLKNG